MTQHRTGKRHNVVEARRQPSAEQRAGTRRQHQCLCGTGARTPCNVATHNVVVRGFGAAAAHQGKDRLDHLLADRHAADQRLRRRNSSAVIACSGGVSAAMVVASSMVRSASSAG